MTLLYDPRPLSPPEYPDEDAAFELYCMELQEILKREYNLDSSAYQLQDEFYAQYYFETDRAPIYAADAIWDNLYNFDPEA